MAGSALMTAKIEAGAALVRELDARKLPPETAAWVFFVERDQWKLVLQFDESQEKFPTLVEIAGLISGRDDISREISMGDITVARPTDAIVGALKALVHTGPGVSFFPLGPVSANGIYFEDGLVYRARDPLIPALR
jgi:hypothetical protein